MLKPYQSVQVYSICADARRRTIGEGCVDCTVLEIYNELYPTRKLWEWIQVGEQILDHHWRQQGV